MSADDLLPLLRRRPFLPFRLVTTDGTAYEVRHPEMLMPGRRTVTVGLPDNPAVPIYDQQVIVSLLHVQRLEPLQPSAAPGDGAPGGPAS
jgi:hypothetical protein